MNICCDNIYCLWPIILIMKIRKLVESKAAFSKNLSTRCVFVLVLYLFCNCIESCQIMIEIGQYTRSYEKPQNPPLDPIFWRRYLENRVCFWQMVKSSSFVDIATLKYSKVVFDPPSRLNTWQNLSILSKSVVLML